MRKLSEDMAVRSLELVFHSIDRYREDIDKVLAQVENTHNEYELLHFKAYQALLAADRHFELTKEEIIKQLNK